LMAGLAARPLVRRLADAGLHCYVNRRLARLDYCDAAAIQEGILLRLVRTARFTSYCRAHGFSRIRTIAHYQQRRPLRTYEQFWTEYWQSAFPRLQGVTWPSRIPYLAFSSGTTSGATKYVPVSNQMLASNRRAALTTLAMFLASHPDARLFKGKAFFLGGSTDLMQMADGIHGGDLSGIAAHELPVILRLYTFPPLELALLRDWEQKITLLAERSAREPITAVGGVPSWLHVLFERVLQITGKSCLAEVWPRMHVVIHGGTKFDPYQKLFRRLMGSDVVRFHETYPASEGFVATEDHRHGLLRLIPDHGIFFEFVPVEELSADKPVRHTVANL